MKRMVLLVLGVAALSAGAFAQAPADPIEKALAAAPRNLKEGADGHQVQGRRHLRHAEARHQPAGLLRPLRRSPDSSRSRCSARASPTCPRIAQNMKFEAMPEKGKAAVEAAEKDGTRVKPEFGSVWYTMNGADQATARIHITIAVPGATTAVDGPAERQQAGRRLDHERGHLDRPPHDAGQLGIKN